VLTQKTAGPAQQKLAIYTNNELKADCEYPVYAGEIVNCIVTANRGRGSTNHPHLFVPVEGVIRFTHPN